MKLTGYILPSSIPSLCIPVYCQNGINYRHILRENSTIQRFELIDKTSFVNLLNYSGHDYNIGDFGALVLCKKDKSIISGTSDLLIFDIWNHITLNKVNKEKLKQEVLAIGYKMNINLEEQIGPETYSLAMNTQKKKTLFDPISPKEKRSSKKRSILKILDEDQKLLYSSMVIEALAHPLRISILDYIHANGSTDTVDIFRGMKVDQALIFKHIDILTRCKILRVGEDMSSTYSINYRLISQVSASASAFVDTF